MPGRVCVSREWKRAHGRSAVATAPLAAAGPPSGSPFNGTLYFADLSLDGPGGPWSTPAADVATLGAYLARAAAPIAAYASQYGPTKLAVSNQVLTVSERLSGADYGDADLQGWLDRLVQRAALPATSAILVLNPVGVVNRDARESGGVGVLGYHGLASVPYGFVNALGTGFTLDDRNDLYAEAVSHEIAELVVDPRADGSQPEVCDGCGTNCHGPSAFRNYFDASGAFAGGGPTFPPPFPYAFFLSAIARPAAATLCPAPTGSCVYPPP